jgi:hypothetical protein
MPSGAVCLAAAMYVSVTYSLLCRGGYTRHMLACLNFLFYMHPSEYLIVVRAEHLPRVFLADMVDCCWGSMSTVLVYCATVEKDRVTLSCARSQAVTVCSFSPSIYYDFPTCGGVPGLALL